MIYLTANPQRPSVYYPNGTNQAHLWVPFWRSTNGGESFLPPINAVPGLPALTIDTLADGPKITVDNLSGPGQGTVYLSFIVYDTNRTFIYRSESGGLDWTYVNQFSGYGQLRIGPNHEIYFLWSPPTNANVVFLSLSTNRGNNFVTLIDTNFSFNGRDNHLTRSALSDAQDFFRAPYGDQIAVNPVNRHLYFVYADDKPNDGTNRLNIYFRQSTNGGTNWSTPIQVNLETNSIQTDQWGPALTVKPDGTKLFMAWYDRRDDPTNHSLIRLYGVFAALPITGTNSFATNFPISTVAFPAAFTGTNDIAGAYDPVYPPLFACPDPRRPGTFQGLYKDYMGDYDTAVSDDQFVYYTWGDNRNTSTNHGAARNQADVRFIRVSWPP